MKTWIINLADRPERLAFVADQLDRLGVDWQRYPAVDLRQFTETDHFVAGEDIRRFNALGRGEIGCLLSHKNLWQELADSKETHACVLEDDVLLAHKVGDLLKSSAWVPKNAPIVRLETHVSSAWLSRKPTATVNDVNIHRSVWNFMGTAGYIISRPMAQHLVKNFPRNKGPADFYAFKYQLSKFVYQTDPALAIQTDVYSEFAQTGSQQERFGFSSDVSRGRGDPNSGHSQLNQLVHKARAFLIFTITRMERKRVAFDDPISGNLI